MSADRDVWGRAQSFEELCGLAARFLDGELAYFPGWMADDIDEETDPLVDDLLVMCEAGFLPLASQPGHPRRREHDGRLWSRRAFVTAFARPEAVHALAGLERPGWCLRAFPSEALGGPREPVGLSGGVPYLWTGDARGPEELELFHEDLSSCAQRELAHQWYVSIHDPRWGRGGWLFEQLGRALRP